MALLQVDGLRVDYRTKRGIIRAVDGVSFGLEPDENLGIVGESGCGKTTIAKAILRILPSNARVAGGHIYLRDSELLSMDKRQLDEIRWKEISMIPQSAMNALNPVYKVEDQMVEIFRERAKLSRPEALEKASDLFELVGLNKNRLKDYPHQFSGGMKQRVEIAMALALNPTIIIADEPTTALDVIIQDQVLQNIFGLQRRFKKSIVLITHDISLVAENCDKIAVMYAGKLMEYGDVRAVFQLPFNPYTIGLLNAFPSLTATRDALISMPGSPPNLMDPPKGCRFYSRCPFHMSSCFDETPPMVKIDDAHFASCHRVESADDLRRQGSQKEFWEKGVKSRES